MKPVIITDDIEAATEHAAEAGMNPDEIEFLDIEAAIARLKDITQQNYDAIKELGEHPDPRFSVAINPMLVAEAKVNAMLEFLIPQGTVERLSWSLLFEETYLAPLIAEAKEFQRQQIFGITEDQAMHADQLRVVE